MREAANRMAELEFEAPLAQIEDADDCLSTAEYTQKTINGNDIHINKINTMKSELVKIQTDSNKINDNEEPKRVKCKQDNMQNAEGDNFTETFSGSLEDLVNTFDEKITKCFGNYEESVEKLAPVQVRTQEEIMNECQMWWTITGNFGNILPIDWTKSFSRKMHIPTLNLSDKKNSMSPDDEIPSSEDEAVASDLDMHALILGGLHQDHECPVKTADEVIQEIDDMMQDTPSSEGDIIEYNEALEKGKEVLSSPLYEDKLRQLSLSQLNEIFMELETLIREFSETLIAELALRDELEYEKELKNTFISLLLAVQNKRRQYHAEKKKRPVPRSPNLSNSSSEPKYLTTVIPFHLDNGPPDNQSLQVLIKKLRQLSLSQLNEIFMELETLIREFSETLIAELALRDELEYEKELKNTFISLLLAVQNKRRQYHAEKKKRPVPRSPNLSNSSSEPKYLTTVIPFHLDNGPPDNQSLQVLIKILKAINEDSPTVPTLLTDYILKVLCPT